MTLHFNRTKPFRNLQKNIGKSTYQLNTIFVGLNCISDGAGDGGAIAVTWTKPSEQHRKNVANQAKTFACASALLLGADSVESYFRNIVRQSWAGFSQETIDIVTKAKTKSGGVSYSVADRVAAVCSDLSLNGDLRVYLLGFLGLWRNVIAHAENDRSTSLSADIKCRLLSQKNDIYNDYSHLDIELAIKNYEARKTPVGKEVTSLLAVATNFCRVIDEATIRRKAGTEEQIISFTDRLLTAHFNTDREDGLSSWAEASEAWQGPPERRKRNLAKILQNVGVTRSRVDPKLETGGAPKARRKLVSHALPERYLDEVVELDIQGLATRFSFGRG